MDAVLKVIGIVGAAWLLLSILLAVLWAAVGRRIFREPPSPFYDGEQGDANLINLPSLDDRRGDR